VFNTEEYAFKKTAGTKIKQVSDHGKGVKKRRAIDKAAEK
jgi:hypothetical protein